MLGVFFSLVVFQERKKSRVEFLNVLVGRHWCPAVTYVLLLLLLVQCRVIPASKVAGNVQVVD